MFNNDGYSLADIAAATGNGSNGGWGDGWGMWIWVILIFAIFGWGNGGYGAFGGGYGNQGASNNYVLASDFATIQRQLSDGFSGVEKGIDTIRNGLCDGFYTEAQLINGVNMNIAQNGYESRLATQQLSAQLASCCCDIKQQIGDVKYTIAEQANGISRQIENGFCQTNFNMANQSNATLQAIDKVGDRIIDYLSNQETQRLRDEVAAYRDRATAQGIVNEINKCPIPAYLTCNPNAPLNYSINYGNGCGCGSCQG